MVWFFYNLLQFDIVNADVPFYKRGHNLEMEVKLNKAQHPFSNKVSVNAGANFQQIPLEDTHKQTKTVHSRMQFFLIKKKTKNVSWDFYDKVLKSPLHWQLSAQVSLLQQWLTTK